MKKKNPSDSTITLVVASLVAIGVIMVFSSSFAYALVNMNDSYFFLKRVSMWAVIGSIAMYICAKIPYRLWSKYANLILLISIGLLIAVLTPIGTEINGASRWIILGGISVMPSEIAKFAVIIFIPISIHRKKEEIRTFSKGVMPYLLIIAVFFVLIYSQPDFSTAFVVAVVIMSMLFVGGMKMLHFISLLGIGLVSIMSMITYVVLSGKGHIARRITSFLDPWADPLVSGFQAIQSLLALGAGGLFGRGLGRSVQKQFYLPEPQNDFIFAIIGEELGFIGCVTILLLFVLLIWRGIKIAINAPDLVGCLMATGIITIITIQVVINVAVATSSMPVTGMALPFISFGGNSLVIFMALIGILLNISKYLTSEGG
ncbi:MAG: putative lipid II flippase FtsW [Clostridiales bacterium]|nr:putative lipid II flippase FtsW [Clostridiales bacterium]